MKKIAMYICVLIFGTVITCSGCGQRAQDSSGAVIEKLDFTLVEKERLPEELLTVIEEKKAAPFKLTFTDVGEVYICIGYGEQKTGGYSIQVNRCDLLKNAVLVDTSLLGPDAAESKKEAKSYPYIVIRTKDQGLPVIFD